MEKGEVKIMVEIVFVVGFEIFVYFLKIFYKEFGCKLVSYLIVWIN